MKRLFSACIPLLLLINIPLHENVSIESMLSQINEEMLEYYLTKLVSFSRYTGSEGCWKAEEWTYNEFISMGLDVEYQEWKMGGYKDRNVIATLKGRDDFIIVIGAHIDAVKDSQGADDNGSGVAAVLAVAKVLSQYEFLHTIRFLIYSGEEVGTYGSYNYARQAYEDGDKIIAVLNPDMVGFANTSKGGKYIRFFEAERSKWLTDFSINVSKIYYDLIGLNIERVPNYPGSDHQAFIEYGYDAVFIAHYDGYAYSNSPLDTIDKINFTYEKKAARLFAAIVATLANRQINTYVQIIEPKEGYLYVFNRPILPIICRTWYLGLRGMTIVVGNVNIIAEAYGNVEKVIFCIDDRMMKWDHSPPYEWKLNAFVFWKHKIKVYAYGDEVAKDEMDIIAFVTYKPKFE